MGTSWESGTIPIASAASRIERAARAAYRFAELDPDKAPAPSSLLIISSRGMLGPLGVACVDVGIPPGRAAVEYSAGSIREEARPIRAKLLRRQGRVDLNMAIAHACAQVVAWGLPNEEWSPEDLLELARAIILPASRLQCSILNDLDPGAIADAYATDVDTVLERIAVLQQPVWVPRIVRLAGDAE